MNKHSLLGAAACLVFAAVPPGRALAQGAAQYSYISDRTFTSPDQLMGYDFKPAMREVPGEEPEEVPLGKYSFGVTRNNLYVEGPGIRGVYSVNQTDQTEYGFLLKTMNARDPTVQGHLKIVTDEEGHVEGLIFKRSNDDKEVIFFLRVIPPEVEELEAEYFTHVGEHRIPSIDSLWGNVEVRPFMRTYLEAGIQQRITPADSVYVNFYKVVTVEERERGAMASLGIGRKGKRRSGTGASLEEAMSDLWSEPLAMGAAGGVDAAAQREQLAALLATLQAGELPGAASASRAPARADTLAPATDSLAGAAPADTLAPGGAPPGSVAADPPATLLAGTGPTRADTLAPDSLGLALVDSTGAPDSLALAQSAADSVAAAVADTKFKVDAEYFIDINAYTTYDDGTSAMQHKTFQVFAVTERENGNSRAGGNRYQWEFELDKKRMGYVYLDEYFRVNSIELDGQAFFMRGR